jgi:exopolysaccharide biosynthesis operon protein EpsL
MPLLGAGCHLSVQFPRDGSIITPERYLTGWPDYCCKEQMSRERCCRKSTSTLCLALLTLLLAFSPLQPSLKAQERTDTPSGFDYFVGAGILYDDNLFRQPAGFNLSSGASNLHRQDLIERVSAGIQGSWTLGLQSFELKAHGDDNRFERNDKLNNISGSAAMTWDWRVGHRWTGQLGADYARALANFANNLVLDKDLLTQRGSFAGATYELGPHWLIHGDVRWSSATHSAAVRRVDDDNIRTQKFGVELKLSSTDSVGWNYRHANANFAGGLLLSAANFDRNYDESSSVVWVKYALSGKTDLNCEGGYVRRNYPNAAIGNFTGATGRGTLNWHPGAKTAVAITGWRDLNAYIDAQSNYFVTRGASITPSWAPTEKITTSVAVSWERQNYIGSNPTVAAGPARLDTVKSVQASATYMPSRALELDISYRREQRDSNQASLTYVDNLAVLGVRLAF